jgi:hypothetical protein
VKECDVSRDESSQCRKTLLPSEEPVWFTRLHD